MTTIQHPLLRLFVVVYLLSGNIVLGKEKVPDSYLFENPYTIDIIDRRLADRTFQVTAFGPELKKQVMEWIKTNTTFPNDPPWLGQRAVQPVLTIKFYRTSGDKDPLVINYYAQEGDKSPWTVSNDKIKILMSILNSSQRKGENDR